METLEPFEAPGLPASWLNAWLAAIGVTVLLPDVRLSWSQDDTPHAIFWGARADYLATRIAEHLPATSDIETSPIARHLPDLMHPFNRSVTLESYRERAEVERRNDGHLLAATLSDLKADADVQDLDHSPFDPPAPRGETLSARALSCRRQLPDAGPDLSAAVAGTLSGAPTRVQANGLGFDSRRLGGGVFPKQQLKREVDPVVELLILPALRLFPFRGDGQRLLQRGFTGAPSRIGALVWRAWPMCLDSWGIDAWLDRPTPEAPAWRLIPYRAATASDVTRAYFSDPIR